MCLLPVSPCLLSTNGSCFTLFLCLPPHLPSLSLSLPSQEVDCHGNVVQERVEQAMEGNLRPEKRGRSEVGEELEANDSAHVPIVTFELFVL